MIDRAALRKAIVVEAFRYFPPVLRTSLLNSRAFITEYGLETDARVVIGPGDVTFKRSLLYDAIRKTHAENAMPIDLSSAEGEKFSITLEGGAASRSIVLRHGEREKRLSDFSCLSPDMGERQLGLSRDLKHQNLRDEDATTWIDRLKTGPLADDEVDELTQFLHLTPQDVMAAIGSHAKVGETTIGVLVPPKLLYYERLVGRLVTTSGLEAFATDEWRKHVIQLLAWDFSAGLRQALVISPHETLSSNIPFEGNREVELSRYFQWVVTDGDRFSQVAAVEFGLRLIEKLPALEEPILEIVKAILADDPTDKAGRLMLTSSLIILVDGEFGRIGLLRDKPPYWRRLAAIAQASLIECELLKVGIKIDEFSEWATDSRGQIFFLQSMVDLRLEPRWMPEFISPNQLKLEFLGRIYAAGMRNKSAIQSLELRELVTGSGAGTVSSAMKRPMAYLPGPLEGGSASPTPFPDDLAAKLRDLPPEDPLNESDLAGIVNMALIFKIEGEHARVVADALRRAKYQVELGTDNEKIYSLLLGLANVAAATRAPELAKEVRILARVQRRRAGAHLDVYNLMRIGLISSASEIDLDKWCANVGEWFMEISYEDLDLSLIHI